MLQKGRKEYSVTPPTGSIAPSVANLLFEIAIQKCFSQPRTDPIPSHNTAIQKLKLLTV